MIQWDFRGLSQISNYLRLSKIILSGTLYLLKIYLKIKRLRVGNYFSLKDTALRMLFDNNNNFQIYIFALLHKSFFQTFIFIIDFFYQFFSVAF